MRSAVAVGVVLALLSGCAAPSDQGGAIETGAGPSSQPTAPASTGPTGPVGGCVEVGVAMNNPGDFHLILVHELPPGMLEALLAPTFIPQYPDMWGLPVVFASPFSHVVVVRGDTALVEEHTRRDPNAWGCFVGSTARLWSDEDVQALLLPLDATHVRPEPCGRTAMAANKEVGRYMVRVTNETVLREGDDLHGATVVRSLGSIHWHAVVAPDWIAFEDGVAKDPRVTNCYMPGWGEAELA